MSSRIQKQQAEIIKASIRRFHHLPNQTIVRHILNTHRDLFLTDKGEQQSLDYVRRRVRYYLGKSGAPDRSRLADTTLLRPDDLKVTLPKTWRRTVEPYHLPVGLWLILSDIHIPFHEPLPLEQAIKYGQAQGVDGIFINGDMMDCAAVSYWPAAHRDFNRELEEVLDFLDFLRQEFPKQKIVYKPGNHEYRLPRYFVAKAPELAESPMAAIETVLGFEKRDIEFLDYYQTVYAGLLPIIHGHEVRYIMRAVNPARGLFLRTKSFSACSHCHTTSEHTSTTIDGEYLTCWSFGCLCDLHPEYNPIGNDWNWGFGLVNVEKDGDFEVDNRRVLPSGDIR